MLRQVLTTADVARLLASLPETASLSGGARCLLDESWCAALAEELRSHPLLQDLLGPQSVAVQCTYFEKSSNRNWLVPMHQDRSVPVANKVIGAGLTGWSEKEGQLFVHGPLDLLKQLVAVRVHLDDCRAQDGPLRVVPGSHQHGLLLDSDIAPWRQTRGEVICEAVAGDVLVLSPLLLHASSKASGTGRRRLLHFVFGPCWPGHGLAWRLPR
ncbi:MAG: phytanoyl-CoA dioxygenase family protein [Rhizobacter sp.]